MLVVVNANTLELSWFVMKKTWKSKQKLARNIMLDGNLFIIIVAAIFVNNNFTTNSTLGFPAAAFIMEHDGEVP